MDVLGETGIDMSRFPSEGQVMSWACLVPRNDESAGKRRSPRMRKGGTWLKTTMVRCAWAAARKADSRFAALFARLKPSTIYHMLKDGTC